MDQPRHVAVVWIVVAAALALLALVAGASLQQVAFGDAWYAVGGSGYVFPTNNLILRFEFATASTTNNLVEATNNFSIVAGRGTTVVLGEGLVTTSATGNCGTYLRTPVNSAHETTDKVTLSAWVKWKTLADRDTLLYGNSFILRQTGTSGNFNFYLYGAPTLLTVTNICQTSSWQHLVFVSDRTNLQVYVNAVKMSTNGVAVLDIVDSTAPKVGSDGTTDTAQFSLDSLAMWSSAFSAEEVTNLFNGTKGTKL